MGDVGGSISDCWWTDLKVASEQTESSLENIAALTNNHLKDCSRAGMDALALLTDYYCMPG